MNYAYIDAPSGLSGDMILAALLDLGADRKRFKEAVAGLKLPVEVRVREVRRCGLRGLKVDVLVERRRQVERRFEDVEKIIQKSRTSPSVRTKALAVFRRLFEAEAKVHGRKFEETHLHEAGADDALVDIVGACHLLEDLEIAALYCSPLNLGSGWVKTSHGILPVPPPAVAELMKGAPVYSAWVESELVTPTGAALVSTLAEKFVPFPELSYERIGCGAGAADFPTLPNILRIFLGDRASFSPGKNVFQIEAAMDDASPQVLARFLELILEKGALDASLSPIVMKKSRLGTKLTILAQAEKMDDLIEAVFRETTSIGVRYFPVERRVLPREVQTVQVLGREVRIKVSSLEGRVVNVHPEYDDCLKLSRETGRPLKDIMELAHSAYGAKR